MTQTIVIINAHSFGEDATKSTVSRCNTYLTFFFTLKLLPVEQVIQNMKCSCSILLFILALTATSTVHCARDCCPKGALQKRSDTCNDDTPIIIPKCAGYLSTLDNEMSFMTSYVIKNDSLGEYLDDYIGKYIVRSSSFCLADTKVRFSGRIKPVAVICTSDRIYYKDMKIPIDESDNPDYYVSYFEKFNTFADFLSTSFLAIAFYIYYLVIPARQVEDNCLLHFAGCTCLAHAASLYSAYTSTGLLPDFCITHLYVSYFFILSCLVWYALFMYYVWKKFKSGLLADENTIQRQFQMIGYGGPAFIILLVNIHAHSNQLYAEFSFETDCVVHSILIADIYVHGPALLAIGLNCFFWRDLSTYVGTAAVKTSEDESNKMKINSLLTLNRRLFFVFGLPSLINVIVYGVLDAMGSFYMYLLYFYMDNVNNILGAFIAVILVMSRARVWKYVILKYKNIELLQKWQPSDEDDVPVQPDNSGVNVSKTIPSEV